MCVLFSLKLFVVSIGVGLVEGTRPTQLSELVSRRIASALKYRKEGLIFFKHPDVLSFLNPSYDLH